MRDEEAKERRGDMPAVTRAWRWTSRQSQSCVSSPKTATWARLGRDAMRLCLWECVGMME